MARFTVEDTFQIKGSLILAPGLPFDARIQLDDPISIKRPDGSILEASISGIALGGGIHATGIDILLKNVGKDDVPIGSEVWSVDQRAGE